jgi:hypothetical protein
MSTPPPDAHRARHSVGPEASDPGRPKPPHAPTLAAPPPPPAAPHAAPAPTPPATPADDAAPRHRSLDEESTGGHSVAELLARLEVGSSGGGGGRRRRREE